MSKVFFAIPAYRGIRCPPMLESLNRAVALLKENGHESAVEIVVGSPYLQTARSELVRKFIDSNFDIYFSLDDDISFDPEAVLNLVEKNDEFTCSTYRLKCDDSKKWPVAIYTDVKGVPMTREDGAIPCSHAPAGFYCIKRSAIEKLISAYPDKKYLDGDVVYYDLWCQGLMNGRWWGEDFAFCELWRRIGEIIWLYPNVTFKHWSWEENGKYWEGNYHEFLMNQPKPE